SFVLTRALIRLDVWIVLEQPLDGVEEAIGQEDREIDAAGLQRGTHHRRDLVVIALETTRALRRRPGLSHWETSAQRSWPVTTNASGDSSVGGVSAWSSPRACSQSRRQPVIEASGRYSRSGPDSGISSTIQASWLLNCTWNTHRSRSQ